MKKEKKSFRKILMILFMLFALFVVVTVCITLIGNKANLQKAESFSKVEVEDRLVPQKDENGYWTFTTDREMKVLQLTDVHIGGGWMSLKKDAMALNAVAAMVAAEKPDLVIATGDIAYPVPFQAGTFNNRSGAKLFAALMEQLGVYWTVTFGNHDTELYSYYSREKIADFYENSGFKYCLFQSGPEDIDGYGNTVINVKNTDGKITQSLFLMDSHSYADGDYFGIFWKYDNIHENQVEWYKETVQKLNSYNASVTGNKNEVVASNVFIHIPLVEQKDAWYEYVNNGFKDTENVKYIYGDAGEGSNVVYPGIGEDSMFETILELGSTKAVFFGHDHRNNFSVEYKGIRLTYGMSVDYLAYPGIYKEGAQRGCTVITYKPDGSFDIKAENYYQEKYQPEYAKETVVMQEVTYLADLPE